MTYMFWSWKWLLKNVISCHQTPIIISLAFGVGGDYSQGCSWQLEKINGGKEMGTNVKINLLTEQNIPFVFSLGGFACMLEKGKYTRETQGYKSRTRNGTFPSLLVLLGTHARFLFGQREWGFMGNLWWWWSFWRFSLSILKKPPLCFLAMNCLSA